MTPSSLGNVRKRPFNLLTKLSLRFAECLVELALDVFGDVDGDAIVHSRCDAERILTAAARRITGEATISRLPGGAHPARRRERRSACLLERAGECHRPPTRAPSPGPPPPPRTSSMMPSPGTASPMSSRPGATAGPIGNGSGVPGTPPLGVSAPDWTPRKIPYPPRSPARPPPTASGGMSGTRPPDPVPRPPLAGSVAPEKRASRAAAPARIP